MYNECIMYESYVLCTYIERPVSAERCSSLPDFFSLYKVQMGPENNFHFSAVFTMRGFAVYQTMSQSTI